MPCRHQGRCDIEHVIPFEADKPGLAGGVLEESRTGAAGRPTETEGYPVSWRTNTRSGEVVAVALRSAM